MTCHIVEQNIGAIDKEKENIMAKTQSNEENK